MRYEKSNELFPPWSSRGYIMVSYGRFVDEDGDCLDLPAVLVYPVKVVDLKVRKASAVPALLEFCYVLLQVFQVPSEVDAFELDVVFSRLICHLAEGGCQLELCLYLCPQLLLLLPALLVRPPH